MWQSGKKPLSSLECVKTPNLEIPISLLRCTCLLVLRSVQELKELYVLYPASIVLHNILVMIAFLLDL